MVKSFCRNRDFRYLNSDYVADLYQLASGDEKIVNIKVKRFVSLFIKRYYDPFLYPLQIFLA